MIDSAILCLPEFEPGSVWLVGAGPGDPGLLSALALHALAHGDVVAYVNLSFECSLAGGAPALSDETSAVEWFDLTSLPENIQVVTLDSRAR